MYFPQLVIDVIATMCSQVFSQQDICLSSMSKDSNSLCHVFFLCFLKIELMHKVLTHWPLRDVEVFFSSVFFKLVLGIDTLSPSCDTDLRWVA